MVLKISGDGHRFAARGGGRGERSGRRNEGEEGNKLHHGDFVYFDRQESNLTRRVLILVLVLVPAACVMSEKLV